jgi:hypothetical protein
MQSFRFLNPKTPFLAQYSAPTLQHCAQSSNLELLSSTTTVLLSTSIGFRQTTSQAKGHLSLLSLLSKSIFPEQKSWAPGQQIIRSWIFGNQPKTNWKSCQKSYLAKFQRVKKLNLHQLSNFGNQFPESGLHDAQSIAKADKNEEVPQFEAQKDDLFPVGRNPTKKIDSKSPSLAKYLLCYQQP